MWTDDEKKRTPELTPPEIKSAFISFLFWIGTGHDHVFLLRFGLLRFASGKLVRWVQMQIGVWRGIVRIEICICLSNRSAVNPYVFFVLSPIWAICSLSRRNQAESKPTGNRTENGGVDQMKLFLEKCAKNQ